MGLTSGWNIITKGTKSVGPIGFLLRLLCHNSEQVSLWGIVVCEGFLVSVSLGMAKHILYLSTNCFSSTVWVESGVFSTWRIKPVGLLISTRVAVLCFWPLTNLIGLSALLKISTIMKQLLLELTVSVTNQNYFYNLLKLYYHLKKRMDLLFPPTHPPILTHVFKCFWF